MNISTDSDFYFMLISCTKIEYLLQFFFNVVLDMFASNETLSSIWLKQIFFLWEKQSAKTRAAIVYTERLLLCRTFSQTIFIQSLRGFFLKAHS